jgi:CRISPR-associated protein Csb3
VAAWRERMGTEQAKEIPDRGGATPWKCFAGQQKASGIAVQLIAALGELPDPTPDTVLQQSLRMGGRYGFDPRSSWDARGTGFSPDEQKAEAAAYPYSELLTAVALQVFPVPADGWAGSYCLWREPLGATLTKVALAGLLPGIAGERFQFAVVTRNGRYKTFDFATLEDTHAR